MLRSGVVERSGKAVEERHPIQHHCRANGTEQYVFHGRLGLASPIGKVAHHEVRADRYHFDGNEGHQPVGGQCHQVEADVGAEQDAVEVGRFLAVGAEVRTGVDEYRKQDTDQGKQDADILAEYACRYHAKE